MCVVGCICSGRCVRCDRVAYRRHFIQAIAMSPKHQHAFAYADDAGKSGWQHAHVHACLHSIHTHTLSPPNRSQFTHPHIYRIIIRNSQDSFCVCECAGHWPGNVRMLLPKSVSTTHLSDHRALRRLINPAFTAKSSMPWIPRMAELVESHLRAWSQQPQVKFQPENKRMTFKVRLCALSAHAYAHAYTRKHAHMRHAGAHSHAYADYSHMYRDQIPTQRMHTCTALPPAQMRALTHARSGLPALTKASMHMLMCATSQSIQGFL